MILDSGYFFGATLYSKCMPVLLYGLEACALLTKADIRSLGFVLNRFFMKLFKTNNVHIIYYGLSRTFWFLDYLAI